MCQDQLFLSLKLQSTRSLQYKTSSPSSWVSLNLKHFLDVRRQDKKQMEARFINASSDDVARGACEGAEHVAFDISSREV